MSAATVEAKEVSRETTPTRSIIRKLAEVTALVDRIAKNGRNATQNYSFVTEADILDAVRLHMAERRLVPFPHVKGQTWETLTTKSGGTKKLCTFTVDFRIEDGDSGEVRTWDVISQGEDTGDKAAYKAITGAEKYALLKVFMIATGDDPERDSEVRHTPQQQPRPLPPTGTTVRPLPTPQEVLGIAPIAPVRDKLTMVNFGPGKGKHLCDLTDEELHWHSERADADVAKNDPKFHKSNMAKLGAIRAEIARRISPTAADIGNIQAPRSTSERTRKVKAVPNSGPPEPPPHTDDDAGPF